MNWTDNLDKSKYSPETLARWKKDAIRAKKQHSILMKNPHRDLPDLSPARMAHDDRMKSAKSKALMK